MQVEPPGDGQRERANSARDRSEPRLSLGPDTKALSPEPRPPKSYNLVACGAKDTVKDGFIFGDFLGFCMALKAKDVGGDFWSCFPLFEHFKYLETRKPPITDIKFGKFGPNRAQALWTYTKFESEHRERWWKQVGQKKLKEDVLQWIKEKASVAEPGDVINIIFDCPGVAGGGLCLGSFILWPRELIAAIAAFKDEVQVNIITNACYGSTLVGALRASGQYYRYAQAAEDQASLSYSASRSVSNRFRNMRFAQAVVMALARLDLPGVVGGGPSGQVRLMDQEIFIKNQMLRNLTPNQGAQATNPSSYQGSPTSMQSIVRNMIFRDSIDVLYDPAATHRRRRIEWPTQNTDLRRLIAEHRNRPPPSQDLVSRTAAMLDDEFSKCDINSGIPADDGAVVYYHFHEHNNDFGPLLKLLYWRGRQQSAVYDIYEQLCMRHFILGTNVILPMSLTLTSHSVQALTWLLCCFEGPSKEETDQLFRFQDSKFDMPLQWLATMIVRSSADIGYLLETILAMRYLGELDEEKYEEWKINCPWKDITCNPNEGACAPNLPSQFGFWLPHGVSAKTPEDFIDSVRQCMGRFNRIETLFQEWFGLEPKDICTEDQQQSWFSLHPEQHPD